MKKINKLLLCSACILTFALSLSGCGKSDEEAASNNTTITDNQKKEPEKINILVNADYLENFKTSFADTTYFNQKMSHACVDITISKKTDFIIRNTFKLTLQVSKYIDLGGGGFTFKYIDTSFTLNEDSFSNGKCLINCPVNEHGQFNFNNSVYQKMIGITSLG